jgi:hypothetical protein
MIKKTNAGFIFDVQLHISSEWRFWHSFSPAILDLQTAMPVYKHHRYLYSLCVGDTNKLTSRKIVLLNTWGLELTVWAPPDLGGGRERGERDPGSRCKDLI